MSAVKKDKQYSVEEYLELEAQATYKSEYHDGEIWAMAGAKVAHSQIVFNANRALGNRLSEEFQGLSSDTQVRVDQYSANVYPDLSVVCGKIEPFGSMAITNPVLIVKVLSDSTENHDRTTKFKYYRSLPSFKEYVLIDQKKPSIQTHVKSTNEAGEVQWLTYFFDGMEDTLVLHSLDIAIPLNEIYLNVEFEAEKR